MQTARMPPLQHVEVDRVRNIQTVSQASTWVRMVLLGFFYQFFHLPFEHPYDVFLGQDGGAVVLTGEGIRLGIPRPVGHGEW